MQTVSAANKLVYSSCVRASYNSYCIIKSALLRIRTP